MLGNIFLNGLYSYVASFLFKQCVYFFITLQRLSAIQTDMTERNYKCETDPDSRKLFAGGCSEAKEILMTSAVWKSLMAVSESTFSCGFTACSEVALTILDSKAGLVFVVTAATVLVFYFIGWLERRKEVRRAKDERIRYQDRDEIPDGAEAIRFDEVNTNGQRRTVLTSVNKKALSWNQPTSENMTYNKSAYRQGVI